MNEQLNFRPLFDDEWYLDSYPDVAQEGIEAWQHFIDYGFEEGRLPCQILAFDLERALWTEPETDTCSLEQLESLYHEGAEHSLDSAISCWVLARWHGSHQEWEKVEYYLDGFFSCELSRLIIRHQGPWILLFSALFWQQKVDAATALLDSDNWLDESDKALARSMVARSEKLQFSHFNAIWQKEGLVVSTLNDLVTASKFDRITHCENNDHALWRRFLQRFKVTVIIPCFNAETTIGTALQGLMNQLWRNLEILVVDDCSTDGSVEIISAWCNRDKRIRLIRHTENQGAYAARNTALKVAKGHFITVHDSDDWSHPDKLRMQALQLIKQPKIKASVSHWVRCDSDLNFQRWRMEEGWIYRNISSLMFRASVIKKIGYWDCVSVNADTEYYYRIKRVFGEEAITEVLPGVPLSFGRVDASSLTQQSATHLRTQFSGVRKDYHEAAMKWQQSTSAEHLFLSASPTKRPFPVPSLICRGDEEQQAHNDQLLLEGNPLFDSEWYLEQYSDVQGDAFEALRHYCFHGAEEGRDPSAMFSTSGYRYAHRLDISQNPLVYWQEQGDDPSTGIPHLNGDLDWIDDAPAVLACGHLVSEEWFGAERSFLDVLTMLSGSEINQVAVLPSALSPAYINAVRAVVQKLVIVPYHWWHLQKAPDLSTVKIFKQIIHRYAVVQVYVNTLVLSEPLIAAESLAVERVIHVRELPPADKALCEVLGASPDEIRQQLLASADKFIANSSAVATYINDNRCYVLPNMFRCAEYVIEPVPSSERLSVGMLSSNLPKKGLIDFVALAQWCEAKHVPADFRLYGPENEHIKQLQDEGQFQGNLFYMGYVEKATTALIELDIVVNLSHFQESFGRSMLEAMAAKRCVIAYHWGALPELIKPGCGFLVPMGDVNAVGEKIVTLVDDRELLCKTAQSAMAMVAAAYDEKHFTTKLMAPLSPFYRVLHQSAY